MQQKTVLAQGGTVHYWIARNDNVPEYSKQITTSLTLLAQNANCQTMAY